MPITLQKIAGAILAILILVVGLNLFAKIVLMPPSQDRPSPAIAASEGGFKPTAEVGGETRAAAVPSVEKPLAERLAVAAVDRGLAAAKKCQSCHTFDQGGPARVGPNLFGVAGRTKAASAGFAYSDAVKKLGGAWTYEDLDKFLTKPGAFAAGTKMTFAGLPDGNERADVIAYLRSISPSAPPLPQ